jgi:hypothetical protein
VGVESMLSHAGKKAQYKINHQIAILTNLFNSDLLTGLYIFSSGRRIQLIY